MPIDAGIYQGLNTNSLAGGLADAYTQALQQKNALAAMAQQRQLTQNQLTQSNQNLSDEQKYRQALQDSGGDPVKAISLLRQAGLHTQANDLTNQYLTQQKTSLELGAARNTAVHNIMGQIATDPNNWQMYVDGATKTGSLHPEDAAHITQTLSQLPPDKIPSYATQNAMDAKDMADKAWSLLHPDKKPSLVETYGGQQIVDLNDPKNQGRTFGPKPNPYVLPSTLGGGNGTGGLHGDALLQNLDPNQAAQVKALAEGRMAFPAGFALKSPYWQDMISKVSQYDPNFDAVNYNARMKTRNDFTSGPSANNITALNTAIKHLGSLNDAFDNLDNGSIPAVNAVSNWVGNQLGNSKIQNAYTNVATDSTAVSHELAKVFRQSGMSEGEIKDWQTKINTNMSPEQKKAVIESAIELMNGRLSALGARYNQGMGTTADPLQLLTPDAQAVWNRLKGSNNDSYTPQSSAGSDPNIDAILKKHGVKQ